MDEARATEVATSERPAAEQEKREEVDEGVFVETLPTSNGDVAVIEQNYGQGTDIAI